MPDKKAVGDHSFSSAGTNSSARQTPPVTQEKIRLKSGNCEFKEFTIFNEVDVLKGVFVKDKEFRNAYRAKHKDYDC